MKLLTILLLGTGFFLSRGAAQGTEPEPEELQFLIIETLARNPAIAAEIARMKMYEEKVPQAGALADPEFTYKLMEFPGTQTGKATFQNFELMQMVMFPTKLITQRSIARLRAEHAHNIHLEKELEIIARLKTVVVMLWSEREKLRILAESRTHLENILRVAETRYAVGTVSRQEVLKTSIELERLKTQEVESRQNIAVSKAMLRAILNRAPEAPIGMIDLPRYRFPDVSLSSLHSFALANRPMVVHDSVGVLEGDLMVSMSRQEYLPDFRFSVERVTMPQMGVKTWSVMAGISLPFAPWSLFKASARVEEAKADRTMRDAMYRSTQAMVTARISELHARVTSLEARLALYETSVLPKSDQILRTMMTEYQTGTMSYMMLIDGFRMYLDAHMDAVMVRAQFEEAIAELSRETGVFDLRAIPAEPEKEEN